MTGKTFLAAAAAAAVLVPSTAQAATITVRAKDSGKIVALGKGDRLRVVLDENPSTGYAWRTTTRPSKRILPFVSSAFTAPAETDPPTTGAGGKRTFVYRAARKGSTSLALAYVGPGSDRPVGQRFRLSISVR